MSKIIDQNNRRPLEQLKQIYKNSLSEVISRTGHEVNDNLLHTLNTLVDLTFNEVVYQKTLTGEYNYSPNENYYPDEMNEMEVINDEYNENYYPDEMEER